MDIELLKVLCVARFSELSHPEILAQFKAET